LQRIYRDRQAAALEPLVDSIANRRGIYVARTWHERGARLQGRSP